MSTPQPSSSFDFRDLLNSAWTFVKKHSGVAKTIALSLTAMIIFKHCINPDDTSLTVDKNVTIKDTPLEVHGVLEEIITKMKHDEFDQALVKLLAVEEIYGDNPRFPVHIKALIKGLQGECYFKTGQLHEAEDALCECLKLEDMHSHFIKLLSDIYFALYEETGDEDYYKKAKEYGDEAYDTELGSYLEYIENYPGVLAPSALPLFGDNGTGRGMTYSVLIGVGDYKDEEAADLPYIENDLARIESAIAVSQTKGLRTIRVTGKNATKENILRVLRHIADNAGTDDRLFIYFTGHGLTIDENTALPAFPPPLTDQIAILGRNSQFILPYDWSAAYPAQSGLAVNDIVTVATSGKMKSPPLLALDVCRTNLLQDSKVLHLWNIPKNGYSSPSLLSFNNLNETGSKVLQQGQFSVLNNIYDGPIFESIDSPDAVILNAVSNGQRAVVSKKLQGSLFTYALARVLTESPINLGRDCHGGDASWNETILQINNWIETTAKRYNLSAQKPSLGTFHMRTESSPSLKPKEIYPLSQKCRPL